MESVSRERRFGIFHIKTQSQYGLKLKQEPLAWLRLLIAYQRATAGVLVGNEWGADPGQSCLAVIDDIQSVGRVTPDWGHPGVSAEIIFILCNWYPLLSPVLPLYLYDWPNQIYEMNMWLGPDHVYPRSPSQYRISLMASELWQQ